MSPGQRFDSESFGPLLADLTLLLRMSDQEFVTFARFRLSPFAGLQVARSLH